MTKSKYILSNHELLQTNDAAVWARAFMRIVTESPDPFEVDEGFMIGWFANAMEAQRLAMERANG